MRPREWQEPRLGAPQFIAGCLFWIILASPAMALLWWVFS